MTSKLIQLYNRFKTVAHYPITVPNAVVNSDGSKASEKVVTNQVNIGNAVLTESNGVLVVSSSVTGSDMSLSATGEVSALGASSGGSSGGASATNLGTFSGETSHTFTNPYNSIAVLVQVVNNDTNNVVAADVNITANAITVSTSDTSITLRVIAVG